MANLESIKTRVIRTSDAARLYAEKRAEDLARAIDMVLDTYRNGGKVLLFGNGGSAAEAQHIAAEFVNRMVLDREPLGAIALTTDTSNLTSIANDYSFDEVYVKQVKALGRPGDLAWGLSTSGTSKNVILALEAARQMGLKTLGMAGRPGSKIGEICDHCLWVDDDVTAVVQEIHLMASHIICEAVERELFGGKADG